MLKTIVYDTACIHCENKYRLFQSIPQLYCENHWSHSLFEVLSWVGSMLVYLSAHIETPNQ